MITTDMIEKRNEVLVRVSKLTGVALDDIMSHKRTERVSTARHLVIWVLSYFFWYDDTEIGILLHKNRTSVIYGRQRFNGRGKMVAKEFLPIIDKLKENYGFLKNDR